MDRLGVASTFFVLPGAVAANRQVWAAAVQRGHEIGNHTMRHPCSVSRGRRHNHALQAFTLSDMRQELLAANASIRELLGVDPWVFAYPCGQTFVGRGAATQSYVPLVAEMFGVGRTFNDLWGNSPAQCDLAQVACINSDGLSFEAIRPGLEETLDDRGWLVLGGHEVAETSAFETTAVETLEAVVQWCRERGVWIDTVGAIGRRIQSADSAMASKSLSP
jgi:peptidoglycan-N-acetylglucosamine deacetylase